MHNLILLGTLSFYLNEFLLTKITIAQIMRFVFCSVVIGLVTSCRNTNRCLGTIPSEI